MKVFKSKKDVKLTCGESLCLVKVAEYPTGNTSNLRPGPHCQLCKTCVSLPAWRFETSRIKVYS